MKQITTIGFLLLATGLSLKSYGQKIKIIEGDLSPLKGQTAVKINFTYDDMTVGKYKEEEYVSKKKEDYNKKEAGRGDKWEQAWIDDRGSRYEPSFEEQFQKSGDLKVEASAKYTLIIKTTFLEPGYNTGLGTFGRKNAEMSAEIWLVETADKSKPLAKVSLANAPGRTAGGYDFDTGARIAEAYEMAGKSFAKFISKSI
jgi:hypothetical protein